MNAGPSLAGILEPVFAVRTEDDLGVGDTEGARQMIDWCAGHHLNLLQTTTNLSSPNWTTVSLPPAVING
jgi:hypothetical protein